MGHNGPLPAAADILFFIFLSAVFGLTPFVFHSVICFIAARFLTSSRLAFVAAGGLLGILALVVPFHVADCYALYGPGRLNSTSGLAFVFLPFYCIPTLCLGLLVGWLVSLLPRFR